MPILYMILYTILNLIVVLILTKPIHILKSSFSLKTNNGIMGQFLIKRIRRSNFFAPSQQWQRLVRMLAIEKILSI